MRYCSLTLLKRDVFGSRFDSSMVTESYICENVYQWNILVEEHCQWLIDILCVRS